MLWPAQLWPIGARLVEVDTGATWWIDEHDPRRDDVIGVIQDVGEPVLQWMEKGRFRRVAGGR